MGAIILKSVPCAEPYEAYLVPISQFPIPNTEAQFLDAFLGSFATAAMKTGNLTNEVFLQLEQLVGPESRVAFSSHARSWKPQTGLGVWVDRDPPQKWTKEEVMQMVPGDKMRPIMFQVFRVSTSREVRFAARSAMLRFGSILEILTPLKDGYLRKATPVFKTGIVDTSYTCFPYYVGLFEGKTISNATRDQLDCWFDGMNIYMRQSFEDQGVLIASSARLTTILEGLGGERTPSGWRINV